MELFLTSNIENSIYRLYDSSNGMEMPKITQWIDRLSARLADNSTDDDAREDLRQICKAVIQKSKQWKNTPAPIYSWQRSAAATPSPFSDNVVARVVALAVELDSETMFLDLFDLYSKEAATSIFQSVGKAVLKFGLESLLPK
jgi:acetylornithine deacetylase/succinyl-diaminopimelate desuccinylase-like protein